ADRDTLIIADGFSCQEQIEQTTGRRTLHLAQVLQMALRQAPESEEETMYERRVNLPTIALIAGTRVALGAGLGLLLSGRLTPESRRAAGWALFALGALTTIPLAAEVLGAGRPSGEHRCASATSP